MTNRTKADQDGPFKEFVFEGWVRENVKRLCQEIENKRPHLGPSNFRKHVHNAQRERLLAAREFIDNAIDYLDKLDKR